MLSSLSIKNYALIENLKVDFKSGLSIITGETGAGKSILLGGLALVLGKRADNSLVYDKAKKCVIEADFQIENYHLQNFFEANDLDYDSIVIIRREILPNGKSRAFINDTPVNLTILNDLSSRLIDIHSQHETLQLADAGYQYHIIDSLAGNEKLLEDYQRTYRELRTIEKELERIKINQAEARKEYDYHLFLWEELEKANLKPDEQEILEKELEKLSHVEEIKAKLSEIIGLSERESMGTLSQLSEMSQSLNRISAYSELYESLYGRLESLLIEFKDILGEIENENDQLVYDPGLMEEVDERLQLIYNLQKKHLVQDVTSLIEVRDQYKVKIEGVEHAEEHIEDILKEIRTIENQLKQLGGRLYQSRVKAIPEFISLMENTLKRLEMKNTRLSINLEKSKEFLFNGQDRLTFLMSSDKGKTYETLKKVASGGEMSRIMLAVKSILSDYSDLPAIIFDEIDSGVSGEVSNRIAEVMQKMSENMQVITITHLPQVAAKGHHHFKVFKKEVKTGISSNIKLMNEDERLVELAEMLGGSKLSESALAHARQLLS
ncbi:DNA repair protein RecN [Lutimonas zeaxanthinifaciens]|uniref:DNA repair protein RecN n=1 Tax=Lutimonas zeaxanthinifaciens TaxID=3060215 RepID=UPI00265D3165|nr:DNA repair protein RecN [Lutimonas sp. YSD2104]WKK64870.1 DNA repair protein RecN [Lutimonas sp. YSD2104]